MTKMLLIVHHTPSPHCQEMFEAVVAGRPTCRPAVAHFIIAPLRTART